MTIACALEADGAEDARSRKPRRWSRGRAARQAVGVVALAVVASLAACSSDAPGGAAPAAPGSTAGAAGGGVGKQLTGQTGTVDALTLSASELDAAKAAGKGQTVGILAPISAEYLSNVVNGAKEAADSLGLKTQVVDYQFDAAKGVSGIESLTSQGVKYIVAVLTDPPAMIGAVKAAQAQGVTFVQFAGAQVAQDAGGYSVAINDKDLGTAAGDAAAQIAKSRGAVQIAILDFPSQPNVVVRADAMEAAIKAGAPQAQIVARVPGGTQDIGLSASESLLQKFPNLGGIVSVNDAGAYGAVQALEAAKKTPANAFVVGCDAESKARQQIATGGIFRASVDTQPSLTGKAAVEVIGKLLAGRSVAQYTTVPVKAVTS